MKQENSFGNIKTIQKQKPLFTLIYLINSRSEAREIINVCLITISMIGNMLNFLSLPEIYILKNQLFVLDKIFNLIFLPFLGLILLQLIIGYFYQLQFFISIQWKAFRFIVYPFLMSYLLKESLEGQFLSQSTAVIFLVLILIISLILTAVFSTQSYVYKKLLHRDLPLNFHLLIIETLFLVCNAVKNPNIKITCGLLIAILSFTLYNNNFAILKQNSIEYRILGISTFLLLWAGIVCTIALFTHTSDILSILVASIPCLLYKIGSDLSRERAPVPYRAFASIFDDPDTIYFEEFIDSMQPIIEEIMQYYYSQNKKDFVQTLLMSYYYEHSNRCLNVNCPFRNEDYKYEMKNTNDSKNLKEVLFKICKKIQFLYYGMYKTWPQHIDLKLSLVQFYIFCFPNKIRALQIISEIQLSKLSLQQEYELFRVKILCQNMNSLEVAGQIKLDQRLIEFENLIYLTLNTMMEFWSLFYEEKVDFNKLTSITSKIFPLRQKIQEIFQSRLCQQTFSTLQILKLYSLYCGSIENNQDKSWKINDYLEKLRHKLQQHKEIEYLSFDSEIGLLALSLSENKLGNIAMVNSQASSIFCYSKKQFKTIKVNEIMPKTFSQQHDNYLKVFLQNRTKKINSDERKLLGKNKSGYIFPILLQLQRTISSTGDELLFIANIKKLKLKQAYISCVTDEEGQICDYSSTFDYLFLRNQKTKINAKTVNKNIQQFIPQFFDPNIEEDQNTHFKHFKQTATLKNYGNIEIDYTVMPVSFPLKQNGGFIIQGKTAFEQKPIVFPHISMTESLRQMISNKSLSCHKNYYNEELNRYEITKEQMKIKESIDFKKQFTIPFININDVTDIFGIKKQEIVYGQNIKTIRLVKDHFERVQDATDFQSQFETEQTQSAQTINQIMELKQSIVKQKKPAFMKNIKIALLILSITCAVLSSILVSSYSTYADQNLSYLNEVKFKFQTRGYLSEYVTFFTALKNGFSNQTYQPMLDVTKNHLIDSIESSPIDQNKKQEILKIFYLQSEANLTSLLNQYTLVFDYNEADSFSYMMTIWNSLFILILLLVVITILSYFLFLNQLESVYQVFMCLQQKIIKKLYFQCKNLAKVIQNSSQKDKVPQKNNDSFKSSAVIKTTQQNEEDDENPVKKIRKFKQNQRFRNLFLFVKLIFPFLAIIILSIISAATISTNNSIIKQKISVHKQILNILPETSVFLMNTFLKNVNSYQSLVSQDFTKAYQSIDLTLFRYEQNYPGKMEESFFVTLFDNVCKKDIFNVEQLKLCSSISEGTMTVGLSKSVNYFANTLIDLQKKPNNGSLVQNFNDIILLEYKFIFPLVQQMAQMMYDELSQEAHNFSYQYSTLTIIIIILIGLNFLYFLKYPADEIEQKIYLSKGLIDLLPEYYKNEKVNIKQGYEQIKDQKQNDQ